MLCILVATVYVGKFPQDLNEVLCVLMLLVTYIVSRTILWTLGSS